LSAEPEGGRRGGKDARHRVEVVVTGGLVDVLDALVALSGRPHADVASDLLEEGLGRASHDPDVERLMRARSRRRRRTRVGLRLVAFDRPGGDG
jgi:hypothetical protein